MEIVVYCSCFHGDFGDFTSDFRFQTKVFFGKGTPKFVVSNM